MNPHSAPFLCPYVRRKSQFGVLVRENDSVNSLVLPGKKASTERAYEGGRRDIAFLCEYLFVRGGCAEETDEDGYVGRVDWV